MKVIYHCYGGSHASPVAAAMHLGQFTAGVPTARDIQSLYLFDSVKPDEIGRLIPVGTDDRGNQVYVLGCGKYTKIMLQALAGFTEMMGGDSSEYLLVNVLTKVNVIMRIGGYLSRQLGWVNIGRPLVTFGTRRAVPALRELVSETLERLNRGGHRNHFE